MSLCSARRNPFDPVPRHNTLRSSRAKGLASLLLLAATFAARAQGGPPFRTDDPETPGNLHWEINFGFIADRNPAAGAYQVPDFDINYGFGDRIQLKYEMPIAIEETRPQPGDPSSPGQTVGGLGDSQPGIKWRFYERHPNDPYFKNRFGTGLLGLFAHTSPQAHPSPAAPQPEVNFSISTYPQLTLGNPTRSVSRGIVGAGPNFLLPLEFNARFGPIRINGDVGYNFGNRSTPQSWARGFLFGHEFSDRTEAYLELYDQQDSTIVRPARGVGQFASPASKQRQTTLGLGGRQSLNNSKTLNLLLMGGRSFQTITPTNSQPTWIAYVGLQVLFGPKAPETPQVEQKLPNESRTQP